MSLRALPVDAATEPLELAEPFDQAARLVRLISWCIAVGVAAFLTWTARFSMNPDGLSYLDIADNYLRRDWGSAINAYWSPLYPWVLAIGLSPLRPSPAWEFPAIQLINFVIFLLCLWSFDFFWSSQYRFNIKYFEKDPGTGTIPKWAWLTIGYSLFLWTIARAVLVSEVTPDLLVAAIIYLICAVLMRIRAGDSRLWLFLLLGLLLGLGYLGKSAMLPLGFVFLFAAFLAAGRTGGRIARVLAASLVFLVLSGTFILAISRSKGRFTFGESGRLGYAWVVDRTAPFFNWQGEDPAGGTPKHPTRKLLSAPALYEFRSPVRATYPPHYDPSYWNEGLTPHFKVMPQIRVLFTSAYACYDLIIRPLSPLLAVAVMLVLATYKGFDFLRRFLAVSYLWLPAAAAFMMYALITVEARYVAGFVVMLCAAVFSSINVPRTREFSRLIIAAAIIAAVSLTLSVAERVAIRSYEWKERAVNSSWLVADSLRRLGIQRGDAIATLGSGYNAYWARLAQINIVAEVPTNDVLSFWAADSAGRAQVLAECGRIGAKVIVTPELPKGFSESGWYRLGNTGFFAYPLQASEPSPGSSAGP